MDEATGGIIADDMGLGKSIITLSIVAGSIDRALSFASQSSTGESNPSNGHTSKATLVVAPSSCK
jgi:SWI/SNF-related matrix-associated actin-dependent regulator of chromatin subfamily A3